MHKMVGVPATEDVPELDEFWRNNRRTFAENGDIVFVPSQARLRREDRERRERLRDEAEAAEHDKTAGEDPK